MTALDEKALIKAMEAVQKSNNIEGNYLPYSLAGEVVTAYLEAAKPNGAEEQRPQANEGAVQKLQELGAFLLGEAPYMGLQFGDSVKYGRVQARYWWRTDLRKILSALAAKPSEQVVEECHRCGLPLKEGKCLYKTHEAAKPSEPVQDKFNTGSELNVSSSGPKVLESVVRRLAEWDKKYPKNTIHNIKGEKELDGICDNAREALAKLDELIKGKS